MKNILFVCTGNSCRSVMAEGLFKKYTESRKGEFMIGSAGINALDGYPSTLETIRVMQTEDIDISGHRSRRLTYEMAAMADHIYVMEEVHREIILRMMPEAKHKLELLSDYSPEHKANAGHQDIPDPIRMSDSFYRNVLVVIRDCCRKLAEVL